MTDESFREAVRGVIKAHNPEADELRALADDLEDTADRWDQLEAVV